LIDDDYDGIVDNETGITTKQNPSRLNCTDRGLVLDKSCNLIDDDGNGYADDVRGWDFINNDSNVQAGEVNPDGTGTTHATQMAGILAANGNNARGIAGVNWATKILPIQAIDDDEYGNTLSVSRAIRYAADRNADVINLGLGGSEEDSYLREAIQYALDKGSIVVAASGNDGCDCISYPARYPEVIAVGAESSVGGTASFSSYGNELDVVAPGYSMNTSSWSKTNQSQQYASGVAGTSFAASYVSGLLSQGRSYQPDASWAELINAMQAKTDHPGLDATLPFSPKIGSGYVRANSFIQRLQTPDTPAIRYYFAPFAAGHTMDSNQIYQCGDGDFPTTPLYELTKGADVQYTINKLSRQQAIDAGWTSKQLWYACIGMNSDKPGVKRTINLKNEIRNQTPDKTAQTTLSPHDMKLYISPDTSVPARASQIVSQPRSLWLGDWTSDVRATANKTVSSAVADRSIATLVAYNIPVRDCGSYSAGGANSSVDYRQWIRELAAGIGNRQAIVILEPDALAQIDCLSAADQTTRYADLSDAVNVLQSQTRAFVYIDAGHSAWVDPSTMATRLKRANITQAQGFALNVSNFQTSASNIEYGNKIAQQTGKNYVIDTSRNGLGANKDWCNPAGRALGQRPTTSANGRLDAYLWIKVPGESDGTCNGGPAAGQWWEAYAQDLIKNAGF
ncbi:MAG: glycoside hydrolase family 6 protein, partial [Candidatus Saccharimonadales bacterium]